MRLATIAMTLAALLLPAARAAAQVESGLHELGVTGSFDRGNYEFTARNTRIDLEGHYGFFVTSRIEIGGAFSFSRGEGDVNNGEWVSALSGVFDWYVGDTSSRAVPYIEAAYGQLFNDPQFLEEPTFASVGPGVKWFFGDGGGALNLSGFYRRVFHDTGGAPNFATGRDEIGAKVGVSIFFGR
ncbi:MAG TPA: hypothetical protein VFZ31_14310 [Vicinamibacterales bacterium]